MSIATPTSKKLRKNVLEGVRGIQVLLQALLTVLVVFSTLIRIRKHLVSHVDFCELLSSVVLRVDIRMVFLRETTEGLLHLLLGRTLLDPEDAVVLTVTEVLREEEEEDHLLRRVNCSAQGAEKCSGRCAWRQEDEKCLLHVPEFKDIEVDVRELLYHRLIEELLRFGEKRRQLFENDLSYMIDLDRPIRDGNEYIIPEKSAAWYELMRMDWTAKKDEEPIFLEEKSSPLPTRAVPIVEETALPDGIEFLFPKAESGKLRIKRSSLLSLLGLLSLGRIEIQPPLAADAKKLTAEQIGFLVRQSHLTVGQVDLRSQEPDLILKKPRTMDRGTSVFFLIIGAEGPAVLTVDPESVTLPDRADLSAAFAEKLAGAEVEQEPAPGPGPGPLQQAFEQQKKLKPRIKGAL